MKQNIKKIISAILAAAAITGCLASCGTKKDGVPTLTWYMPKPIDNMASQELVEEEVNKTFEKECGAKIKLVLIDDASYAEKMNVVLNSGENFDMMMTNPWYPAISYDTNARKGTFADLTKLLDEYGKDIKAKVDPRAWDYVTYEGKIQLIPAQAKIYTEIGWVFKKDLVEKYNFDYQNVNTLRDLEPYLETIKNNEPGVTPVLDIVSPNWGETSAASLGGGSLVEFDEEQEKFFYLLDDERNVEDYKIRNEWYKKGYFPKDALTVNEAEAKKTGNYAVVRDPGAVTADGSKEKSAYGYDCIDKLIPSHARVSSNEFRLGQAISANSKYPELAMKVLNQIWKNPYISNTLAYGIKDIDYVYKSGEGTDNPSVIPKEGADRTWTIWHNYIGPLFDQWDSTWNSKEALNEMQEKNKTAEISKLGNIQFDTSSLTSELAALSEIWTSAEKVLQYGAMNDFDSYLAELDAKCEQAGIQSVIDELNKQYQEKK